MSDWKHKRSVKRRYDLTANIYDGRYSEEQEAKYRVALTDAPASGLILDVGCGTGLFCLHVPPETANIVGIDISKKLLSMAQQRVKTLGNVDLVLADADHLPFPDGEFNVVFSFTVLQNMPKPLNTLIEMKRTARRNADIVVTGLKRFFPKSRLRKLLRDSGLTEISIRDDEGLACYVFQARKEA